MTTIQSDQASEGSHPVRSFPPGFVWGTATASYQIEGAFDEDGRTPSIWDTFSHTSGKIQNGDTGDVACDHYHLYRDDIALMAELGVDAYRFSTSWSRIIPDESGAVNQAGLDFYSRLVDELLGRGIDPVVTLYHWDLPQWIQDRGGWADRDTADRFVDLATAVVGAIGDRVKTFTTLNEPFCSAFLGHASGVHAPGLTDNATALKAAHHLMLGHGKAVRAIREILPAEAKIGVTLNLNVIRPASDSPADLDAVRHIDAVSNRIFTEPMLRGVYPADLLEDLRHITDWSFIADGDVATINAPIDFLGVNFYSPTLVAAATPELREQITGRWVNDPQAAPGPSTWPGSDLAFSMPQAGPYTAMGWRIEAGAFTELLLNVHRAYPEIPLFITENGAAFDDVVNDSGDVRDADRVEYLRQHLGAALDAINAGVDLRGYFLWSLLDNFEWAWGFSKRFGIVYVDFETQKRIVKDSARWYRDVISANALPVEK